MPERIQLSRAKGWRKPDGAIVVARPSRWGNPYVVGDEVEISYRCAMTGHGAGRYEPGLTLHGDQAELVTMDAALAVKLYRLDLEFTLSWVLDEAYLDEWPAERPDAEAFVAALDELRGHDLACWCALDQPCHADVLLELANR